MTPEAHGRQKSNVPALIAAGLSLHRPHVDMMAGSHVGSSNVDHRDALRWREPTQWTGSPTNGYKFKHARRPETDLPNGRCLPWSCGAKLELTTAPSRTSRPGPASRCSRRLFLNGVSDKPEVVPAVGNPLVPSNQSKGTRKLCPRHCGRFCRGAGLETRETVGCSRRTDKADGRVVSGFKTRPRTWRPNLIPKPFGSQ